MGVGFSTEVNEGIELSETKEYKGTGRKMNSGPSGARV